MLERICLYSNKATWACRVDLEQVNCGKHLSGLGADEAVAFFCQLNICFSQSQGFIPEFAGKCFAADEVILAINLLGELNVQDWLF